MVGQFADVRPQLVPVSGERVPLDSQGSLRHGSFPEIAGQSLDAVRNPNGSIRIASVDRRVQLSDEWSHVVEINVDQFIHQLAIISEPLEDGMLIDIHFVRPFSASSLINVVRGGSGPLEIRHWNKSLR